MAKPMQQSDSLATLKSNSKLKTKGHVWRYIMWPISVWLSFRQFDQHDADDYVELTSPIMAAGVAFWVCVAGSTVLLVSNGNWSTLQLLFWFIPLTYALGLALYINRQHHFDQ
jgi:hypothetical protein